MVECPFFTVSQGVDGTNFEVYTGNMKDLHPIISENLAALRKSSSLTQAQLAERLGYSDKAISRWEKGDTLPDINVLYELCDFYGIRMDTLLEKGGGVDRKQIKIRDSLQYTIVMCALSVAIVWLVATVLFVYSNTIGHNNFWQAFIWAIPASCLVVMRMNRRLHSKWLWSITSSVFVWTLLAGVYLQFLQYNIWLVFLIGIPVQIICVLYVVMRNYK